MNIQDLLYFLFLSHHLFILFIHKVQRCAGRYTSLLSCGLFFPIRVGNTSAGKDAEMLLANPMHRSHRSCRIRITLWLVKQLMPLAITLRWHEVTCSFFGNIARFLISYIYFMLHISYDCCSAAFTMHQCYPQIAWTKESEVSLAFPGPAFWPKCSGNHCNDILSLQPSDVTYNVLLKTGIERDAKE